MKFKKIIWLLLGVTGEYLIHNWISKTAFIVENYGVSLSMNWVNPVFLNILFILIVGWFYWRENNYFLVLVLIGGGVNLIDRLTLGFVRDYWNFGGGIFNNLNDWLIGIGILLFSLEMIWKK